ncbi:hypothetical protein [Streptomyces goshikiensis]|uniref:hypothetical protein n=1 Tax=Streptomyces goshikiensis TaxID=1942 RepID=UPI0036FF239F
MIPELGELAQFLRDRRGGVPYAELAARSAWGASTLKRAASGNTLPAWSHVQGYLRACGVLGGADFEHAARLLMHASEACQRSARATVEPRPDLVSDRADLSRALRDAYAAAGYPPLRSLSELAGRWHLSRSTAHRIVTARALPADLAQYLAFLQACAVAEGTWPAWFAAWHKVWGTDPSSEAQRIHFLQGLEIGTYLTWAAKQREKSAVTATTQKRSAIAA